MAYPTYAVCGIAPVQLVLLSSMVSDMIEFVVTTIQKYLKKSG